MSDTIESRGVEARAVTITEMRGGPDGLVTLAGYASTFNDPYPVNDRFGSFSETILPGTWKDSISQGNLIHLLVGHGANPIPLASTDARSLRLEEDNHGLGYEADINPQRSTLHRDVAYAVESGAMNQMSVGMKIPPGGDRWNADNTERFIHRGELIEVSVLTRGANSNTTAGMRSEDILAEIRHLQSLLVERGDVSDTADRHLAGLVAEMARLNKRRYGQ